MGTSEARHVEARRRTAGRSLLCLAPFSGANASSIVLAGDSTPAFSLWPLDPNDGTRQFFQNVLGDGTRVVVTRSSPYDGADLRLVEFYGSLSGVSAERVTDSLTAETLADIDLLVVPPPIEALAPSEIDAISQMLVSGGSLFVIGEATANSVDELQNANSNALLFALGTGLSLTNAILDIGEQVATGAQIEPHGLTEGVSDFRYGSASITSGGTVLLRTQDGSPFATVGTTFVPEPATAVLFALGLGALARSRWA